MNGLTNKEVIQSRNKYGSNTLTKHKKKTLLHLILEALSDPIIKILLIVLAIKIVFLFQNHDLFETIGILISIILAATIGSIAEYGSEEAFSRLEAEASRINCNVIRNGKVETIPVTEIVVGDLVIISSGDAIPADGYIIEGRLNINEASINGESKDKEKTKGEYVYSSTIVYDGEAKIKVDKVGDATLIGGLAKDIQTPPTKSPLKERLTKLAKIISIFGYAGAALVAIVYLLTTKDFSIKNILFSLTLSVTVIVVTVPEGLPMMITLVLSSNMKRLLKNNVLVRRLIGIETSGNINCLLTDKTGTLTEGNLKVTNYVSPSSKKYFNLDSLSSSLQEEITNNLYYNNSSYYNNNGEITGGNQTDKSIMAFINCPKKESKIIDKKLFDSKDKYSSVTISNNITYFKGAKEVLLDKCLYYLDEAGNKKVLLDKEKISQNIDNEAKTGSRIIILTSKSIESTSHTYLGFLIIKDSIRDTTIPSIATLKNAGINVIMITGDNIDTATSIAKEAGIIKDRTDLALTSKEINKLTDEEIVTIYPKLKVIARALPKDKTRLVNILKEHGLVVGMTGDGINDAGALKCADVGFAMGDGTEVSKEASDIIIIDNNIASITQAILFGRTIFKSIRKFIIFQLTVNICAMLMAILGPILDIGTPVTVIQMLWINMIMDTLAGIAFASEPPLLEYMDEPPKTKDISIINKYMINELLISGIYTSLLGIFFLKSNLIYNFIRYSTDGRYLYTAYFAFFIFSSLFNALNARTTRLNIIANISKNKPFIFIFTTIFLIQLYLIYFGGDLFRTYGLTLKELLFVLFLSLSVIPFDWLRKSLMKKSDKVL